MIYNAICRVRATACSHSAATGSLIAGDPMNRDVGEDCGSMGAKLLSFFIWEVVFSRLPQPDYPYQNQYYNLFVSEYFLFD